MEVRHMVKREKSTLRKLIDERSIRDLNGVHSLVKELTSGLIQEIMDAELEMNWGTASMTIEANRQTTAATAVIRRRSTAARVKSN